MDGENNGSKPYEQMDDLGVPSPPIFGLTPIWTEGIMVTDKTNNLYILNFQLGLGSAFQEWNDDTKLTF